MNMPVFECKEFSIAQHKASLKLGTDAILLGSYTCFSEPKKILDIGTGTGILSLMMAQKYNARIIAIDIEYSAFENALYNMQQSKWNERFECYHINLEDFTKQDVGMFDGIICNPPFFSNSLKSLNHEKNIARHTITLNPKILLCNAKILLDEHGILSIIIPYSEKAYYEEIALEHELYIFHELKIIPIAGKSANRCILWFSKSWKSFFSQTLCIRNTDKSYTQEFTFLTKDFYIR